eukprot:SAG11_NODE_20740_length_439_cov_0.855882_1_plen_48_part_00
MGQTASATRAAAPVVSVLVAAPVVSVLAHCARQPEAALLGFKAKSAG